MKVFSFDCESVGLRGPVFAVGYSVMSDDSGSIQEVDCGWRSIGIREMDELEAAKSDFEWCNENIPESVLKQSPELFCAYKSDLLRKLKNWFLQAAEKHKDAAFVVDCGIPVEARFLEDIGWSPYPLHELGTLLLAVGKNPTASYPRLAGELPKHHPMMDARQSARIWLETITEIRGSRDGYLKKLFVS